MDEKILVTGATGLIGSYVVKGLVDRGYKQVFCLRRPNSNLELLDGYADSVKWREGDIREIGEALAMTKGIDSIFHLAAKVSFQKRDRKLLKEINIDGSKNVVNAALENGCQTFLHCSSVSVFPRDPHATAAIDETKPWNADLASSYYAFTKYESELEVWKAGAEGLNISIVNPSIVLGPGHWHQGSSYLFKYAYGNKTYYPNGSTGFVDVRDVAESMILLYEQGQWNERYILNGFHCSYKELFASMAACFDKKAPHKSIGSWELSALKTAVTMANAIRLNTNLSLETIKTSAQHIRYNAQKSLAVEGLSYRSQAETIAYTCDKFMQRYN